MPKDPQTSWKRTLYILFFAQLMVAVGFSSIFPFLPFYVEELGSTSGMSIEYLAGLVYSVQAFTMMLASPVWGSLADRYGRKLMVVRSMFGGMLILLLMAFVNSAEQLVFLRGVQGLITGTIAAANALLASVAPRRQIGYAIGILQVGFSTGIAIGPMFGGAVADSFDYDTVFYFTSVLLLIAGLLVWFGVEEDFQPVQPGKKARPSMLAQWRALLALPAVLVTFLIRFLTSLGRMLIIPVLPFFIQGLLVDPTRLNTFTGLVQGSASAATTVSAVFLGKLGDRIGYRKVLIASLGILTGLYMLQGFVRAAWQLLALQVLVGIAVGGVIPIISALLTNYIKAGGEGTVFGLDNSINAAGRAAAPMMGAAIASGWGFSATFFVTGLVFLASTLLALWKLPPSRPLRSGS